MAKPYVVVMGGGIGGSALCHVPGLLAKANVTLIDDKDYFEVCTVLAFFFTHNN